MKNYHWHTPYSAAVAQKVQARIACMRCHDWDHTERVLHHAWKLLEMENSNARMEIVELAVLIHDVARPEEFSQGRDKVCHAIRGAEIAPEILTECGVPVDWFVPIQDCIRTHRFRSGDTPQSLEAQIVFDADKLDSLGAVGVVRACFYAGKTGARLHNTREEALASPEHGVDDTPYREYLVKLSKIPAKMLTESGRKLAEDRLRFTTQFFDELNQEVYPELFNES